MDTQRPDPARLVIFDCDGVLVDSERIAIRIDVQVLGRLGWSLTEAEVIERFVGRTQEYMVSEIEARLGRRLPGDWETEFEPLYQKAFETDLRPVDGVVEALNGITAPTCVASSSGHERIRRSLGLTGLLDRFSGRIFSAEDVRRGKPAPDLFLHAAARMGFMPAECAVVEDSRHGVEAARAAGMLAFGYAGGVTPAERLEGPGTVVFNDMRELPALLREQGLRRVQ
ncbi:MAG: HAD family hydrolase [Acidimicrobiaceae bacterium]|nr:HAD family hydrolase [Acidimicrobiaceae bacterium]